MTFNVHQSLHSEENVDETGPLWATSAFPYESFIFILKEYANGPKGADQQMDKIALQQLIYKSKSRSHLPEDVQDLCESFVTQKRYTAKYKSSEEIKFYCKYKSDDFPSNCETFLRCMYRNMILSTVNYTRNNSFNDSVVQLTNDDIAQIIDICLRPDGSCWLKVQILSVQQFVIKDITVRHIWKVLPCATQPIVIPISYVTSKIVAIDLGNKQYVCSMSNCYEVQ